MTTTTPQAALLPCPFCGGPAEIRGDFGLEQLACSDPTGECPGSTVHLPCHTAERRRKSIADWNTRANLQAATPASQPQDDELLRLFDLHARYVAELHTADAFHTRNRFKALIGARQPQATPAEQAQAVELPDERALPPLNVAQAELDELLDFIYEYSTVSEGISSRALKLCHAYARAALAAQAGKGEPDTSAHDVMMSLAADDAARIHLLEAHLRQVIEIARTWQPDYATKMDLDTIGMADAALPPPGSTTPPQPEQAGAVDEDARDALPKGFVPLQRHGGKLVYAACMDGGRYHGWLMWRHPDGQWVTKRKLELWEVMQVEDQEHYGIVQDAALTAQEQTTPDAMGGV